MSNWEKFEKDCTAYLRNTFGKYADFECCGGSDSSQSDIMVTTHSQKTFYIEAKRCPAQCGQFVLLPNDETKQFEYSNDNVNPINSYSTDIINHMNCLFDEYKDAGTAGKAIDFTDCSSVFAAWIINAYKDKNVRFVITNNNIILPIEDFASFFNITAKYRVKRSGSSSVGKRKIPGVSQYLKDEYQIQEIQSEGRKLFVTSTQELHREKFNFDGTEYMFSRYGKNYEIRKLSGTANANVIFRIQSQTNACGLKTQEFILALKS